MRNSILILSLAALVGLASARSTQAAVAYAIGNGGDTLVQFTTDNPGSVTAVAKFNGADTFLDAIDFRLSTGQLYGYRDATDTYYTVDLATGLLTAASPSPVNARTNTFFLGMDFNPTIDALRVVTDSTQNIVYNPSTMNTTAFTPLFYGPNDPNAAFVPRVIENAYTNNFGAPTTTTQYVLDFDLNVLATLNNNAGMLTTVGQVRVGGSVIDFDEFTTGFDIFSPSSDVNIAYALLTRAGSQGLYTIDLTNGNATLVGALGSTPGPVYSLAVVPIPEPASLAMAGIGIGAVGLIALRRRATTRDSASA